MTLAVFILTFLNSARQVETLSHFFFLSPSFTNSRIFEKSFTRVLHVTCWLPLTEVVGEFLIVHRVSFESLLHRHFMVIWFHSSLLCSGLSHCKQCPYCEWNLSNKCKKKKREKASGWTGVIPLVVFIRSTLAAKHAGMDVGLAWLGRPLHHWAHQQMLCSLFKTEGIWHAQSQPGVWGDVDGVKRKI